jgi:prephenate dehydrogenase
LALRGRCKKLLAVDYDSRTIDLARKDKIVDQISDDPAEILPQADLIILATPVKAIIETIQALPELHPGSPVVLDLGSTKTLICAALDQLPARFDPIGGHPMCGKEASGLAYADVDLFVGAPFALTRLPRTRQNACKVAEDLVNSLGAYPLWLDPETHDRWTAASSHFPYLVSVALALATPEEAAPMIGPGFRSTTRLASSSPSMMLDILTSNRKNVLQAIKQFQATLLSIEKLLSESDEDRLKDLMDQAVKKRLHFNASNGGKYETPRQ